MTKKSSAYACGFICDTDALVASVTDTALRLELPQDAREAAARATEENKNLISYYMRHTLRGRGLFRIPYDKIEKRYGGETALAVTLVLASEDGPTYAEYRMRGIPDEVYWDTMSDIAIWVRNYRVTTGKIGVGETNWLINHFRAEIFRIGRLQFQTTKISPVFAAAGLGKLNEPTLFVHIPQGEPLDVEAAKASLGRAEAFFGRYFPDFAYRRFITETWLLYSDNRRFMRENSNILGFSDLFCHVGNRNLPQEASKRIFGKEYAPREEETSLQKACRDYLARGGKLGVGLGYIEKADAAKWR